MWQKPLTELNRFQLCKNLFTIISQPLQLVCIRIRSMGAAPWILKRGGLASSCQRLISSLFFFFFRFSLFFVGFFRFFLEFLIFRILFGFFEICRIIFKVTTKNYGGYYWTPRISTISMKSSFFAWRAKKPQLKAEALRLSQK